jgi:hypothetical protein
MPEKFFAVIKRSDMTPAHVSIKAENFPRGSFCAIMSSG